MKFCRICGEKLKQQEVSTGTCKDCEAAVSKVLIQKMNKSLQARKTRLRVY